MAGLGAAWELERRHPHQGRYLLLEREQRLGGLCRTEKENGFFFDYTGHLLHFRHEYFRRVAFGLAGLGLAEHTRSAWVYSKDTYTHYPFQANLYGLPLETVIECVHEYARMHFTRRERDHETFEAWIHDHFGSGIARHFMVPYNQKLYRRHPRDLTPDCTGRFVPHSDLKTLLRGAVAEQNPSLGYNASFHYPVQGGIESLVRGIAAGVNNVHLGEAVAGIDPYERTLTTSSGRVLAYRGLVSTQPAPQLVRMLHSVPRHVRDAAGRLDWVSVLNVNFGVAGEVGKRHWVYVPEDGFVFHRLGFPTNFSRRLAPDGCGSIYLEISYRPESGIDVDRTCDSAVEGLVRMGVIEDKSRIRARSIIDIPYAYVVFDAHRAQALAVINEFLSAHGIHSIGRFGAWHYTSMEDAFMEGVDVCTQLDGGEEA